MSLYLLRKVVKNKRIFTVVAILSVLASLVIVGFAVTNRIRIAVKMEQRREQIEILRETHDEARDQNLLIRDNIIANIDPELRALFGDNGSGQIDLTTHEEAETIPPCPGPDDSGDGEQGDTVHK